MTGKENWVQKSLDNQRDKLFKHQKYPVKPTEKPVVCRGENHEHPTVVCSEQTTHPRFSREDQNLIWEDETNHDRTGKPVVCRDANHERSMSNEVDIDFKIPELPHSVVKPADTHRVRELVKKIENHPHRQSSTRSTTKQSLQPVQYDVQENDSGYGQRRAVSFVRDRP